MAPHTAITPYSALQPKNDIKITESDERPSPKLLHEDISEFALERLSCGTISLIIEKVRGLMADDRMAYRARNTINTQKELKLPARPTVSEVRKRTLLSMPFLLTLSTRDPAKRPDIA